MNFNFTTEEINFRRHLQQLFSTELFKKGINKSIVQSRDNDPRDVYKLMGRYGVLAPNFPTHYGGQGKSMIEAAIAIEEMQRSNIPDTLHLISIQIVGSLFIASASEEQKHKYLLPMGKGEAFGCVLYTEPNAGSDLGALSTEAISTKDGRYKLYGTKVFNMKTNLLDFAVCAAKVRGISKSSYDSITLFIIPLDGPGVNIEPIEGLADECFYRVNLNGVEVSEDSIIGGIGGGWSVITKALALERTGHDYYIKANKYLKAFKQYIDSQKLNNEEDYMEQMTRLSSKLKIAQFMSYKVLKQIDNLQIDEKQAAISKWYASELSIEIINNIIDLIGIDACVKTSDNKLNEIEAAYREAPGNTISAGSSEMMLETVARLALIRN
jgi:alkylation response protein AidB-like acyl-CoA dehydrogenase